SSAHCGGSQSSSFCPYFSALFAFFAVKSSLSLSMQLVTHSMHRFDKLRRDWIALEFAAQAGDVVVHGARGREGAVAPDDVQKALTGDRFAFRLGQQAQHCELLGSKMKHGLAPHGGLPHQVEFY